MNKDSVPKNQPKVKDRGKARSTLDDDEWDSIEFPEVQRRPFPEGGMEGLPQQWEQTTETDSGRPILDADGKSVETQSIPATEQDLNSWLKELNDSYYSGRLSKKWMVVVGKHPEMEPGSQGYLDRPSGSIFIPEDQLMKGEKYLKGIILHEITHIRTGDYHGRIFRSEIRRLRDAGAPIIENDLVRGRHATTRDIRYWIDRRMDSSQDPLDKVQKYVAEKIYHMPVEEFRRRYPNASKGKLGQLDKYNQRSSP